MDMTFEVPVAELDPVRVGLRARGFTAEAGEPRMDGDAVLEVTGVSDADAVRAAVADLASRHVEVSAP